MDQFEKFIDKYNSEIEARVESGEYNGPRIPEDLISTIPVKYYTPTNGIVEQTKINTIKYVLVDEYMKYFYNRRYT